MFRNAGKPWYAVILFLLFFAVLLSSDVVQAATSTTIKAPITIYWETHPVSQNTIEGQKVTFSVSGRWYRKVGDSDIEERHAKLSSLFSSGYCPKRYWEILMPGAQSWEKFDGRGVKEDWVDLTLQANAQLHGAQFRFAVLVIDESDVVFFVVVGFDTEVSAFFDQADHSFKVIF